MWRFGLSVKVSGHAKIQCAAGTYASGQGSSECTEANAGFFVPSDGASRPQQCPVGKFLGTSGARECEDCSIGEISTWLRQVHPDLIQHVDDGTRNDHGHCGRDYREQVLCEVKLVKP